MWFKFNTQLFKTHWQAKPPQLRQRLCFLAILAWEEQGVPKDFEYLSWATGLSMDAVETIWPEFEAVSENRDGKWMMREMWEGIDSYREKSERAKAAIEKRWNTMPDTTPNTTSDTKCITDHNTSGNTDKIRLDKIRVEERREEARAFGAPLPASFAPPFQAIPAGDAPAAREVDQLVNAVLIACGITHPEGGERYKAESLAVWLHGQGKRPEDVGSAAQQRRAPYKLQFFKSDFPGDHAKAKASPSPTSPARPKFTPCGKCNGGYVAINRVMHPCECLKAHQATAGVK